jgi:hypothetical protein
MENQATQKDGREFIRYPIERFQYYNELRW